ncbi:patatin-like phospholipase family protein [Phreatobacter sp. AB_2022a]|uniref:patatin-like phospholipase family protein n=1 Tax=Phreatobacter sp. AB_2022a TaxID=3003134 RepID=UPI000579AFF6|nr:patatin-like phospholipase family protein [Phreatobacter sp. AB_2022a]MCZ0738297.1 patatin-like phospholipase family protein [Phreatobacter sp. AB_2022a]CEJ15449.1 NTE family protein RssA [bacterium YEK0313]
MDDQGSLSGRRTAGFPAAPFALVLGGGGAKGLAHILVIEALDEMGIRPEVVAGSSIGAIIGACYCAGMTGREIRAYGLDMLQVRPDVLRRLMSARVGRFADLIRSGLTNPVLIDPELFLRVFLPPAVPVLLEDLAIPLTVVATDYHARVDIGYADGPLIPAVAGSMAIPGAFRPVVHEGRVLVDGGILNPVPVDRVSADIVLAVDVLDGSSHCGVIDDTVPGPLDALFGAVVLMMQALSGAKLATHRPTIHLRPPVEQFRVLDFLKAADILAACEPIKDEVKRRLTLALGSSPAELVNDAIADP